MTEAVKTPLAAAVDAAEVAELSHEDRAKALHAEFEHAAKHNAPVTPAMLKELKALLLGE